MMSKLPILFALSFSPFVLNAKDLFVVTTSGAADLTVSGNNLPDLLEDAVKAEGAFAGLDTDSAAIAVDYAGVPRAILVDIVAPTVPGGAFTATVRLPGFTKTFVGTSKDDLQSQLKNYIKDDVEGRKQILRALTKIYAGTPVSITDGTPHASTAMIANRAFDEFGLRHARTNDERTSLDAGRELDTGWFGFGVEAGLFETAGGYKGTSYTVSPTLRLGDRWGFVLSVPVRYLEIEGTGSAEIGVLAGIPLQLISESKESHLFWQLTPHAYTVAAGNIDMLQVGVEVGGGLTNRIGYDFGRCTLQMANQLGHFQGLEVAGYDTGVLQELIKNGVSLSVPIAGGWLVEGRAVRTDFLKTAAVPEYYTFGADLAYRSAGLVSWAQFLVPDDFHIGAYYDTDLKDYAAPHVRAGVRWKW